MGKVNLELGHHLSTVLLLEWSLKPLSACVETRGAPRFGSVPAFSACVVVPLTIPSLAHRESGRWKLLGDFPPDSTMLKGAGLW